MGRLRHFFILLALTTVGWPKKAAFAGSATNGKIDYRVADAKGEFSVATRVEPFKLENSLPAGYVKDGSVDYTEYVQRGVDSHDIITFPAFPLLVNDVGIIVASNKELFFPLGSKLILKPTAKSHYSILRIVDSENVKLVNPVIEGDRVKHLSTMGEYGMGIGIYGSSNVVIERATISNCWGDGIYLGRSKKNVVNKKILIRSASVTKSNRNGLSVITVDGLKVESCYFGFCNLTGLDIEGNYGDEELKNISLTNVTTEANNYNGLTLALSRTFDRRNKTAGVINIINHHDVGSKNYCFKITIKQPLPGLGAIQGTVNVINPVWENPGTGRPCFYSVSQPGFVTYITKPRVKDSSGNWLSIDETTKLLKKNIKKGNSVVKF